MKSVAEQVKLARAAQEMIADYTQEQIDNVCLAVGWKAYGDETVTKLAEMAVAETGYGNVKSKIIKHKRKVGGVLHDIIGAKSVGLIERNTEIGISKFAKPVGLVCAVLPATNPTATCGANAVAILKGRNAVIFKPSSRAPECTAQTVAFMREGLKSIGAPEDLIQMIEEPGHDALYVLMEQSDFVVATGSSDVVKAAYSSGTPAYGVGQGNACVIIAEDANTVEATKAIYGSKFFDYASSCSSENAVIPVEAVYDAFMADMIKNNAYLVPAKDRSKLAAHLWQTNAEGKAILNPDVIAKPAQVIADGAGITIPANTDILLVEGTQPVHLDPFYNEKTSPVITVYKAKDFKDAYRILVELTNLMGCGHSCGIHTFKQEYIDYLGTYMKSARITVRQPMSAGNGGHPSNRMPSTPTLGCGTWGGNSTTENITWKHFLNVTWVNEPVEPWEFIDEVVWGKFWKQYGK